MLTAAIDSSASTDPNILPMSLLACTNRSPNVWRYVVAFPANRVCYWVVVVATSLQYDQSCSHEWIGPLPSARPCVEACCRLNAALDYYYRQQLHTVVVVVVVVASFAVDAFAVVAFVDTAAVVVD